MYNDSKYPPTSLELASNFKRHGEPRGTILPYQEASPSFTIPLSPPPTMTWSQQASTTQRSFAAYYPTPSSDMLSPSWIDATAFATNDIYDDLPFNDANFADPMDTGSRAAQDYVLDCGDSPVDVYRWPQEVAALSQHQPDKITWSEARLERLATNYKLLRKSMWKILADKIGEDWWVVEAKVGSSCLQLKSSR